MFSSNNNTLSSNNALNNYYGIFLSDSSNNTLSSNNASNNHDVGIGLGYSCDNNTPKSNNANTNEVNGISLSGNNNILIGNNASNNANGIYLDSSSSNKIYNNFFNNINNFLFYGSNVNNWNTTKQSGTNIVGGLYIGGNYWAYPNGTGVSQTCSDDNRDGICDLIYGLDASNIDFLPLKKQLTGTISGTVRGW